MRSPVKGYFLVLAVGLGTLWMLAINNTALNRVLLPVLEDTRRTTFEHSKAYQEGMVQDLRSMQFEYINAAPEHKAALASVILHRSADFPESEMPADLVLFLRQLRNVQ